MAVEHAAYIYNNLPNTNGIAPADLFTGVQVPRHKLRDMHVWGAPVYVLDPCLQQGKKLPRCEPRARKGIFVGFSQVYSSDVPLILNPRTGHISPQYHVVFDDTFSTVESLGIDDPPPAFWDEINLNDNVYSSHVHRIPLDEGSTESLHPEWLTADELAARTRLQVRQASVRTTFTQPPPSLNEGAQLTATLPTSTVPEPLPPAPSLP